MIRIFKKLPIKSEFAKNTFTLALGTSIAQAFNILFYPILGRIFTPSEFGLLATLSSITLILAVFATGKYEKSVLIADSKIDAASIVGLTLILSFAFLLISFFLLQLFSTRLGVLLNDPYLGKWLFICPISAFAIIIFGCYNEWCVRNKYFIYLSWNKIVNSSSVTLSKVLFGIVKVSSCGLVIGDFLGRIISALGCIFRALQKDKGVFLQVTIKRMRLLAIKYIEFPKIYLPSELINTISLSLPVLLLGVYFNSTEVGYYAMTMNVLSLPISVISASVKDVFRQKANELYTKTGSCLELTRNLLKITILFGGLGSIILFLILPDIFSIVLGKQWRAAGEYSQILLPMIALEFVATALNGILIITNKLKIILYWQTLFLILTAISLLSGALLFNEIKVALIFYSIARSIAYLLIIYLSYKYSKGSYVNE